MFQAPKAPGSGTFQRKADPVQLEHARNLRRMRVLFAFDIPAKVRNAQFFKGLNSTAGDRIEGFGGQIGDDLLAQQAAVHEPPDPPV
jgi:hypothetical protein